MIRRYTEDLSFPEELESRQLPTVTYPIPAEVASISTPQDLAIEAAALRGQWQITDDLFASTDFLSETSRLDIEQALSNANNNVHAIEQLATNAQQLENQEHNEASLISNLQKALDAANTAVNMAAQKLSVALQEQADAKEKCDQLTSQIEQQQSSINTATVIDSQKNSALQTATKNLINETKKFQTTQNAYTTVHKTFLNAQTAYQKNPKNILTKGIYELALLADTQAKQALDTAQKKQETAQNALNVATQEKQTADLALANACTTLNTLQSQKTMADQVYRDKTNALAAAQSNLQTTTSDRDTAKQQLDTETTNDTNLKNSIQSFLVDSRIEAAIVSVHDSAALLATKIDMDSAEEQNNYLADQLALSIQEVLESETQEIGYAKMFVWVEDLPSGNTMLHLRFRNPGQELKMSLFIGDHWREQNLSAPAGNDNQAEFVLTPNEGYGGTFILQLRDRNTDQVIDEVQGTYDRGGRTARLFTQQTPFEKDEPGMLSENPITPSLTVGKISGANVLLVTQTPHDQYYIDCDMGGLLSTTQGSSEGGTTLGISEITLNTARPSNYYRIRLYDRQYGELLDTVAIWYDQPSQTISLYKQEDQYAGSSSILETDAGKKAENMQVLKDITIGVGDPVIANIQQLNMYYMTAGLSGENNLVIDMERIMIEAYKQTANWKYDPANQEAAVQQQWDSMGFYNDHGTTRHIADYSEAQDIIIRGRRNLESHMRDLLLIYEKAVSECMQASVNMYLGIYQGKPEDPLRTALDNLRKKWEPDGALKWLEAQGMRFPGVERFKEAGRLVFQTQWQYLVQVRADVQQVKAYEARMIDEGKWKDAEGNWHAATNEHNPTPIPAGISTSELRLAAKIENIMQKSPRLIALYTPVEQSKLIGTLTALLGDNPTDQQIVSSVRVAMNAMDSDLHSAAEDPNPSLSSLDAISAYNVIEPIAQAVLYNRAMRWFDESMGSLRSVFPIRTDTIVGRIIYAGTEKIFDPLLTNEEKWEAAIVLQRLTDIAATKFMDIFVAANGSAENFCVGIRSLLITGQYGELFPENPRYFENPIFVSAHPDIPTGGTEAYTDERPNIRIRFDMVPAGKTLQKIDVLSQGQVITTTTATAFVTFNMYKVGHYGDSIQVTLKATFMDGSSIETVSDGFNLHPGVTTNMPEQSFDPSLLIGSQFNSLSAVDQAALREAFNFGKLEDKNKELITWLVNNYVSNQSSEAHRFTSITIKDGKPMLVGIPYDNIVRDSAGNPILNQNNQIQFNLNGQCKWWIDDAITQKAIPNGLGDLPSLANDEYLLNPDGSPKTDSNGNNYFKHYSWNQNENVETVTESHQENTFETMVKNPISGQEIKTGDFIQLYSLNYFAGQHTFIVGAITDKGMWVFNSNVIALTPTYQFFSYEILNTIQDFTTYRLQ